MDFKNCTFYGLQSKQRLKELLLIKRDVYLKNSFINSKISIYKRLTRIIECPDDDIKSIQKNILTKLKNSFASMGSKISKGLSKGFEALGEKAFSNPAINNLFEQHEISWKKENLKMFVNSVKANKTLAAILLSGVLTALGIVGAGIYKAGKINGENK